MSFVQAMLLLIRALLRYRTDLAAENLALRQQLAVLERQAKRPKLKRRDRIFWVWLSRLWPANLSVPRLPSPVQPEPLLVPPDDRFGLNDYEDGAPVRPEPRQPNPEDAVALPQSRPLGLVLQDGKLLPEREVLGSQPGLSSKQSPKENEDYVYRTHTPLPNPLP